MNRLHIHHATTGHSSRTCHCQVLNLEHHCEWLRKLNPLSVVQAKHLIIIEHSVHVFYPKRVHWSVENDPFLGVRSIGHIVSYNFSNNTVSPLVSEDVCVPEEFVHGNWFWVQSLLLHRFVVIVLGTFLAQLSHGFAESVDICRFAGSRYADHHHSVTDHNRFH